MTDVSKTPEGMSLPVTLDKTRASESGQVQEGGNVTAEEPLQTVIPLPYHQETFINNNNQGQYGNPNIPNDPGIVPLAANQGSSYNSALLQTPMNYSTPSNVYSMPGMWTGNAGQVTYRVIHHTHTPGDTQEDNRNNILDEVVITEQSVMKYLDRVKTALGDKVYHDFVDIMEKYKSRSITAETCVERVTSLLQGYPDLIEQFLKFCPQGHTFTIEKATDSIQIMNDYDDFIFQMQAAHQEQMSSGASQRIPLLSCENRPALVGSYETVGGDSPSSSSSSALLTRTRRLSIQDDYQPQQEHDTEQFSQALTFVNKIKNRFHNRPEVYNRFLEILYAFQKQKRSQSRAGDRDGVSMTELQVQSHVSKLFHGHEDLLEEFSVFLVNPNPAYFHSPSQKPPGYREIMPPSFGQGSSIKHISHGVVTEKSGKKQQGSKKEKAAASRKSRAKSTDTETTSAPKPRTIGTHAPKYSVNLTPEPPKKLSFFEKMRIHITDTAAYLNYVQLLYNFNHDKVTKEDVFKELAPVFATSPELLAELKTLIGYVDPIPAATSPELPAIEIIPKHRPPVQLEEHEVDYTTCRRLGSSYVAVPKIYRGPTCSGRDYMCKEVLNDIWESFPCWMGESLFCTTKRTTHEDNLNRIEQERYELDFVLDSNAATIEDLEEVSRRMNQMSEKELEDFELDDRLGGRSEWINRMSVKRIYGESAIEDVIQGLKERPRTVVPMVLKRLKQKDDEWRELSKRFKENWREQTQRYMSKYHQTSSKR